MLKAKGPLFKGTLKFIKEEYGEEKLQAIKEKVPKEVQAFLNKPILDSQYYPAEWLVAINEALAPSDDLHSILVYKRIGRYSADSAYRGIYKMLFKIGSPRFMVSRAPLLWKTYYSQGKMEVKTFEGNLGQALIFDSGIFHVSLCYRLEGFIERVLELTGGTNPEVHHTQCFSKGNEVEAWRFSWQEG